MVLVRTTVIVVTLLITRTIAFQPSPLVVRRARRDVRTPAVPPHLLADATSLALTAVDKTEINSVANESFFEKAPEVLGVEIAIALVVFLALKASGNDDAFQFDLLGRRKDREKK